MRFLHFIKHILIDERRGLFCFQSGPQDLPPALLQKVNKKNILANVKRIVPFCAIIFLIEIINQAVILCTMPDKALRMIYLAAGAAMLLLSAGTIALAYRLLKGPHISTDRCRMLYQTFWWLFSFGMLGFVILELSTRGTCNNFIYLLILTATFPLLSWKGAFCLFGVDTAIMLPVGIYHGLSAQHLLQFPLIAIFAWILSRMLYNSCRMNDIMLEQLKVSNQKLADLARTDPLTSLLNRRGIQEQLNVSLSHVRLPVRVGFLMIDIDLFKNYNDKFGHEQGDRCLVKVAEAVQHCVRSRYDLASRFGGEEFLVALIDCEESAVLKVAQRLRQEVMDLALPAASDEVHRYVTVSIGVATVMTPFDFTELYEQADKALYKAKNSNRNCVAMDNRVYP